MLFSSKVSHSVHHAPSIKRAGDNEARQIIHDPAMIEPNQNIIQWYDGGGGGDNLIEFIRINLSFKYNM